GNGLGLHPDVAAFDVVQRGARGGGAFIEREDERHPAILYRAEAVQHQFGQLAPVYRTAAKIAFMIQLVRMHPPRALAPLLLVAALCWAAPLETPAEFAGFRIGTEKKLV